jgi:hypothetical protein
MFRDLKNLDTTLPTYTIQFVTYLHFNLWLRSMHKFFPKRIKPFIPIPNTIFPSNLSSASIRYGPQPFRALFPQ